MVDVDDSSLIPGPIKGHWLVRLDIAGTAVFVASSLLAAVFFTDGWRVQGVVVDLILFVIGIIAFLWGYWTAVQRSRADDIAVASLYYLTNGVAPRRLAWVMNSALAIQFTVAIATAMSRPNTNGKPGSTLAFGVLVPIFGLGLNGLWAAQHGTFSPRIFSRTKPVPPETVMPETSSQTGQDNHHD